MITKRHTIPAIKQKVPFVLNKDQKFLLMPIGDVHWGSEEFPLNHFRTTIEWACDRGAYFIGLGDYLEFTSDSQRAIMKSLRDSVRRDLHSGVRAKADEFLKAVECTKGRWIGMVSGNHTWIFDDGRSVDQYLCEQLGCDYLGDSALIRLRADDAPVNHPEADCNVFVHHGRGGGQTIGGQLHGPEKCLRWVDADLILQGHSHGKIAGGVDKMFVTPDGVLSHRTTVVARTGAFLRAYAGKEPQDLTSTSCESEGSYVERGLLMPSSMGAICFSIGYHPIDQSKYYRPVIHYSI